MSAAREHVSAMSAALALAEEHGLPVFPARGDKSPHTAHGLHDATRSIEQIAEWWTRWPDALVAVPTGRASGLLVVDIDPAGAEWYREHAAQLACARVHRTRRGHHLIYRMPAEEIRCSASRLARGVDVRAEGGYVIWWPAHGYEAVGDIEDITSPPAWLLDLLREPARETRTEGPGDGMIGPGGRNDYLSREAYRLRRQGATIDQILEALRALNRARCSPPLDDDEVRRIAAGKARVEPGESPPELTDTDLANARRLAARYGRDIRYTAAADWLVWDGRRWRIDEKGVAIQALAKDTALAIFDELRGAADRDALYRHARASQSKRAIEAMIYLARSEPGIPAVLTDFDGDPMLLNVVNGTLDLRSGTLRPHRREDYITRIVPIAWDERATAPTWDAFLRRVLAEDADLYGYVQRMVGYCLTGDTSEQVLHFLHGRGANGKSVFCEILAALLGEYAIVCSPELIMPRRHSAIPNDIARLRGARVALMNETTQGSRFDEAKLKDLTGGDTLTGRFLHREFFDFKPTHKLVIRGNHKPAISGTDEGIWRRLRLVPFTVQIPPDEQDKRLLDKLRGELPGILRWAVEGCLDWQRRGLNPPAVVTEAVQQYREESDTLGRFIAEHCNVRKLAQVKSGVFFRHYQQFAEQSGERWIPAKDLPHEMERRGFSYKRGTGGQRLYLGIELIATETPWVAE